MAGRAVARTLTWGDRVRRKLAIGPTSGERRLLAALTEYRVELEGGHVRSTAAEELLDLAKDALDRGDVQTGWACFHGAQRAEILTFDMPRVRATATALNQEASSDKIGGWRAKAMVALLKDVGKGEARADGELARIAHDRTVAEALAERLADGSGRRVRGRAVTEILTEHGADLATAERASEVLVDLAGDRPSEDRVRQVLTTLGEPSSANRTALYQAMLIRDEGYENQYQKIEKLRQHLLLLSFALGGSLLGILLMANFLPVPLSGRFPFGGRIVGYVALFGALGGSLSAIRSTTRNATRARIPEQIVQGAVVFIRPLFGAAAALGVYAFLSSGFLSVQGNSGAAVMAVSFVAGFTERLVVSAVGALAARNESATSS